jgi:hypothetical protein
MAKEKTKEENILDEIKSLKESVDILADSVTTLNRNGLTTSIPATEVDKVVNAAKQGVRQAATHVQLPAPDLSPQTDDIADAVATKVVSQMDDRVDTMISGKTVKIKVEHNHYHYNRMFCNWASSETNRKTMCVLSGIIAVLAIAIGVMLYWYFHSPQYAIKLYHDVKTHPYQAGDIKKNKDHGLDLVYKRRDEGKLDGYIDALEEAKKELNQDKLIWWW